VIVSHLPDGYKDWQEYASVLATNLNDIHTIIANSIARNGVGADPETFQPTVTIPLVPCLGDSVDAGYIATQQRQ